MSYSNSTKIFSDSKGQHCYTTYELHYPSEKEAFLDYIIPVLREEYGAGLNFEEKIGHLSPERTEILRKFMLRNNTPDPNVKAPIKQPWLKNTRSKIAECLAKDILVVLENVLFTCRVSLEEEDPDMPKRGIDNFGFVFKELDGNITLENIVTCEVKASDSADSPPAVVHTSQDSMYASCKAFIDIDKRLQKAIAKSIDKLSEGEYLEFVCNVGESIEKGDSLDSIRKKIMLVPFLLRKKQCYTENDFGKFKTDSEEFDVSTVKYFIVTIDYDLSDFGDEVFATLREGKV